MKLSTRLTGFNSNCVPTGGIGVEIIGVSSSNKDSLNLNLSINKRKENNQ